MTETNEAAERNPITVIRDDEWAGLARRSRWQAAVDKALAAERQAGRQEAVEVLHYFGHEYSVDGRQEWHAYDCLYRKTWPMGGNDEPGCAAVRAILAETEGQQP